MATVFASAKIGAGGLVNAIDMHSDGTMVCRCDVFGAYYYDRAAASPGNNGGLGKWTQLVTTASMASTGTDLDWFLYNAIGVYEIRIAPSNSSIFYMVHEGNIYKSTNKGSTWTKTAFARIVGVADSNSGAQRNERYKMAIDPTDPAACYFCPHTTTPYRTVDSWTNRIAITGITAPDGNNVYCVAVDSSSSLTSGRNSIVYIASSGTGLYKSTDGGASFSLVSGTPTYITDLWCASNGTVYCIDRANSKIKKLVGTTWTDITPSGRSIDTIAVDLTNPSRIIASQFGGAMEESTDAGSTWSGLSAGATTPPIRVGTDTPMIASLYSPFHMGVISPVVDPLDTTKILVSTNQGVWTTNTPFNANPALRTFTTISAGIEEVVGNMSIKPPGGLGFFMAGHDIGLLYQPDFSTYAPAQRWYTGNFLNMGAWIDYASNNSNFLCGISDFQGPEKSGYSTDGGLTWQAFPGATGAGTTAVGSIAAATDQEIIWSQGNDGKVWRTGDRGANWATISGLPAGGWNHAYYNNRCCVAADRVTIGTFYLQNSDANTPANMGTYVVSNSGATVVFHANKIDSIQSDSTSTGTAHDGASNGQLIAVSGNAGHLFFSTGTQGSGQGGDPNTAWPHSCKFWHSQDGGATWVDVGSLSSNNWTLREITAFGLGKADTANGQTYPAIYAYGWIVPGSSPASAGSLPGLWASFDHCVTWTQLAGMHPIGWPDFLRHIAGDPDVFGQFVLSYEGSGWAVAQLADSGSTVTPIVGFSVIQGRGGRSVKMIGH